MISINTHEAKTKLSYLLSLVEEKGETVLICRNGRPVAELHAPGKNIDPMVQHPELAGRILYDPCEPASEEEWPRGSR